jgi:hypothetical protein
MAIHQLQVSFEPEQDRILVRMNTHAGEELRLWLTRRMVKNLFPHMLEATAQVVATQSQLASHDGTDRDALTHFKKQESLQHSDFTTPFNSQATLLPIGDVPLLATTVHITPCADGAVRIGFEEKVRGVPPVRSFEVVLGQDLLHGFMHLLEKALGHADWGISLTAVNARKDSKDVDVDALATAVPPRYLN